MTETTKQTNNVLDVRNLEVTFKVHGGTVQAVRGVSYSVDAGKTLAVVGESGCGKSVTAAAILGLIQNISGCRISGSVTFKQQELLGLSQEELNRFRGTGMAMIFQDPMSCMNPTMTIGNQIAEILILHRGMSKSAAQTEAIRLLDRTQIPEAKTRAKQYPFEFSGGMLQRAVIAMSLAGRPQLLIADEPTTALDLTIQDQVLELMREIQREDNMALILITHDLGVVARMADDVAVMYAGKIVESGPVDTVFYQQGHPYTDGLLAAMPGLHQQNSEKLIAIEGSPPDLYQPPKGCAYFARCPQAMQICEHNEAPVLDFADSGKTSCWLHHPQYPNKTRLSRATRNA